MSETISPRWATFASLFFTVGGVLAICLAIALIWRLAKGCTSTQCSAASISLFTVAAVWLGLFVAGSMYAVRLFGGFGLEKTAYSLIAVISVESALLGLLSFESFRRFLALVPTMLGIYALLPLLAAFVSRFRK